MVVLRDTIGSDSSPFIDNTIFSNADGPQGGNAGLFPVAGGSTGVRIVRVEMVHDNEFSFFPMNWSLVDFDFKMWQSVQESDGSPETGTLLDFPVVLAGSPPPVFVDPVHQERRLLEFELDQFEVIIPAGHTYYFAIPQVNANLTSSGFVGLPESSFFIEVSDWWKRPPFAVPVTDVPGSNHFGAFGIRIFARPLP